MDIRRDTDSSATYSTAQVPEVKPPTHAAACLIKHADTVLPGGGQHVPNLHLLHCRGGKAATDSHNHDREVVRAPQASVDSILQSMSKNSPGMCAWRSQHGRHTVQQVALPSDYVTLQERHV